MSMRQTLKRMAGTKELSPLKKAALSQMIDRVCDLLGECSVDDEAPIRVSVPGDKCPWIVFGSWSDGTLDIVRQDSTGPDIMWGWSPGQSRKAYAKQLLKEEGPELSETPTRSSYPIWDLPKKRR